MSINNNKLFWAKIQIKSEPAKDVDFFYIPFVTKSGKKTRRTKIILISVLSYALLQLKIGH